MRCTAGEEGRNARRIVAAASEKRKRIAKECWWEEPSEGGTTNSKEKVGPFFGVAHSALPRFAFH